MSIIKPQIEKKEGDVCSWCNKGIIHVRFYRTWRYWKCNQCNGSGKFRNDARRKPLITKSMWKKIDKAKKEERKKATVDKSSSNGYLD